MSGDISEYKLSDNKAEKRYEMPVDGFVGIIEYIKTKDEVYLTHTEVPTQLEGKGIGSEMVKQALEDIERQGLRLVPLCPFVATYLRRHPEWRRIVMQGIQL